MERLQPYMGSITTAMLVFAAVIIAILLFRLVSNRVRGGKGARLGVSEYQEIDKSRRLVLVRRDDVEHLLLIGGAQDVVIETNIESPLMTSPRLAPAHPVPQMPMPMPPANIQSLRPAPRPAVFGGNKPILRSVETSGHPLDPPAIPLRPDRD